MIAQLRKIKGYNQQQFADKLGVKRQHLSAIENGSEKIKASGRLLEKIADSLDAELVLVLKGDQ